MVGEWLAAAGSELAGLPGVDLEYSVRLAPAGVSTSGRYTCWADFGTRAAAKIARLLARFGAPSAVICDQATDGLWVRQGIGIDATRASPSYRLYLHGRRADTLASEYRSWRWAASGGPAVASAYSFFFLPRTPDGVRPADLVPADWRPMLAELLDDDLLSQSSGFWLRTSGDGLTDQLDLAFPWHPRAGSLPGLAALARQLGVESDESWPDLPVRHVALTLPPEPPAITLYISGPCAADWPADENELLSHVTHAANAARTMAQTVLGRLPDLERPAPQPAQDLGAFYDGDVPTWQHVLGKRMHYHHGLFHHDLAPDMDAALDRAVTDLYPFIPPGSRLYDIGCGWGGPLAMFIKDLACPSLGLTISQAQFRYVASLGLPVRLGDAELTLPPGYFDCVMMLESFEHIRAKRRLLEVLRLYTSRLVMRVNCQDQSPPSSAFAGTMHMISSTALRTLLESTGWHILHWRDRRPESLPCAPIWHARSTHPGLHPDPHLNALQSWSARVTQMPAAWSAANPLIELAAEPLPAESSTAQLPSGPDT